MRPGVEVISRAQPLPRSAPTDTGVGFLIGATLEGPDVKLVHSLTEYEATFGARPGFIETYDSADVYFREGGSRLYVSRTNPAVLPLGVTPSSDLESRTRAELDKIATDRGLDPADYATKSDLLVALTPQTAVMPMAATPGVQAALDRLTKDYGPGQVFLSVAGSIEDNAALLAHARVANRVALLSTADGDAATLIAAGEALQTTADARYGALFAPSAIVPGVVQGTTRTVPYAALEAGIISRNDVAYNPNQAAAGWWGQSTFALDLAARYTDLEYQDLNEASVDMARVIYDGVRTYGYRGLADPTGGQAMWKSFGHARLNMAIVAQAEAIAEHYVFSQLDGKRQTIASFGSDLRAMLVPYYDAGALYGETADEAFWVDVGYTVNTDETIANGELHAVIEVRMSEFAELVVIEIVKVATTEAIAA